MKTFNFILENVEFTIFPKRRIYAVGSINYLGRELNLSIRPQRYCLHSLNKHKTMKEA